MIADPLSSATRTIKRNLLAVSASALLIKLYGVTVNKIPMSGLEMSFDPGVVAFCLVAIITYFLTTFVVYYVADIRVRQNTKREIDSQEKYKGKYELLKHKHAGKINDYLAENYDEKSYNEVKKPAIHDLLSGCERFFGVTRTAMNIEFILSGKIITRKKKNVGYVSPIFKQSFLSHHEAEIINAHIIRKCSDFKQDLLCKKMVWRFAYILETSPFWFRNYIIDGAFPIIISIAAISATYGYIDISWVKNLAPPISGAHS